jgi:hypothetical protein
VAPRWRIGLVLSGAVLPGTLALGLAGAAAAANGQVCEGVVIDDGNGSASAQAANVAPGTSDLQALGAAGDSATQNDTGLVCVINNFPANGLQNCLATSGGLYYYWSYWQGDPYTNTWTYAEAGPASHTVSSGQTYVEGWRFQNPGPATASATKPSMTPTAAFAQACPGVVPVASSGGATGSGGGGGGSSPGQSNPPPTSTTTSPTPSAGPGPSPSRTTVVGGGTTPATVATTTTRPGSGTSAPGEASAATTTTTSRERSVPKPEVAKAALTGVRHGSPAGGDPALPMVIVAVIIAALGALAWWRWRGRPVEE